ncbi:MAG: CopG family transcriptional regulator [Epsilonproteobacteria bacterium]|nr:CopG family transcriptional regulator [Campylobacterota bacterium]
MMKTVTVRVDDVVYQMIKLAADGQRRNISNFIEFATMQYLTSSQYVDDIEMDEILRDKELVENLRLGQKEVLNGEYTIV